MTWRTATLLDDTEKKSICSDTNISEQDCLEKRKQLLIDILKVLTEPYSGHETLLRIIQKIRAYFRVDAIAIRLKDELEYPYFVFDGFPDAFIEEEDCIYNKYNNTLDCCCGCVIRGSHDPVIDSDCFSEKGSFWTNDAIDFLNTYRNKCEHLLRGRCVDGGYKSIAIIPLIINKEILGTLQLNHFETGKFNENIIIFLEELAVSIAVAVQRSYKDKKIREMEIAKTRDLLESSRLLNSGIAHELRTPMQAMLNCLELIREETYLDCGESEKLVPVLEECPLKEKFIEAREEVRDLIDAGINSAKYCVKVLNSLSEYSKIAIDKEVHVINIIDELKTIIKTLCFIDTFKSLTPDQFKLEVEDGIESCTISINRVDFSQLITNLCRNSLEAISHSQPELCIFVSRQDDYVLIKVVDNGRGIDPSLGDKIFEPYFSTKSNPENYNQGLGLAMVRDIVLAYGGSVKYNSIPGKTEFIIKFPCEY